MLSCVRPVWHNKPSSFNNKQAAIYHRSNCLTQPPLIWRPQTDPRHISHRFTHKYPYIPIHTVILGHHTSIHPPSPNIGMAWRYARFYHHIACGKQMRASFSLSRITRRGRKNEKKKISDELYAPFKRLDQTRRRRPGSTVAYTAGKHLRPR